MAALALFSWLSPNHYYPWVSFHGQLAMACAGVLLAALVFADKGSGSLKAPYLALVTAAVAAIPWLQYSTGLIFFLGDALMPSMYLLAFAFMQVVGYEIVAAHGMRKLLEPLAWLLVIGAGLSVWIALYQWQGLDYLFVFAIEISRGQRPFANLAQPNQLATLLVLGTVGCAYLYQVGGIGKAAAVAVVALLAFGIAMTESRAAILELVCIALWLTLSSRKSAGRITPQAIALVVALVIAATVIWPQVQQTSAPGSVRGLRDAASAGTRPTHWLSMLDAATRRPWFGYGWNQVSVAHYLIAPEYPVTNESLGESHNLFIDLLVWNGLAVGVLVAFALVLWFWVMLTRRHSPDSALAFAAVIAVFTHSMVEFPIYYLYFMLPIAMLMGGLVADLRPADSVGVPRWIASVGLALVVATGAAISLEYAYIEEDVRRARFEAARIGLGGPTRQPTTARFLTQHEAFIRFARTPDRDNMLVEELAWMERVTMRYPHWTVIVRYASALTRNGRPEDATAALGRICRIWSQKECLQAQERWKFIGAGSAKIAAVPFPVLPCD